MSRMTAPEPVRATRPPLAEEALCLDIVLRHKGTKKQPFLTCDEIDALMAPHQGASARGECEKNGWLIVGIAPGPVRKEARQVSNEGYQALGDLEQAMTNLETRIADSEAKVKQFKQKEQHSDLPKLRELREWIKGYKRPKGRVMAADTPMAAVEDEDDAAETVEAETPALRPAVQRRNQRRAAANAE